MFESAVARHSVACPSFDGIGIEHVGFFVKTDGECCSCACLLFQLYQELLLYGLVFPGQYLILMRQRLLGPSFRIIFSSSELSTHFTMRTNSRGSGSLGRAYLFYVFTVVHLQLTKSNNSSGSLGRAYLFLL